MSKQVYISADYACDGDRDVAEVLQKWGINDFKQKTCLNTPGMLL